MPFDLYGIKRGLHVVELPDRPVIHNTTLLATSDYIKENPEIVEAHRRSIPVIPRAEMLAELMRLKPHSVAVAGSHGKTTTTSMVATVLGHAGLDPTIVVGGVVGAFGSNAHLGTSDLMVVDSPR